MHKEPSLQNADTHAAREAAPLTPEDRDLSDGEGRADLEEPKGIGVMIRDLLGSHSEQTGAYFD